jgi:C-terminal processing protease CtpA/Prc
MGIVEAYKLGEIIGESTAGTNGNICPADLYLGYSMAFTGMKVLNHDGSRHHGAGILPMVPVARPSGVFGKAVTNNWKKP